MSDRYKVPPMGSHDQEPAAGNGNAVKIVAIIAGVLLAMFLICAGILSLVVYTVRSSWDRNLQAFRETASQQAEKAQAWQEKNIEQMCAEWAKQDADRGEGKRFAESFLAACANTGSPMPTAKRQRRSETIPERTGAGAVHSGASRT